MNSNPPPHPGHRGGADRVGVRPAAGVHRQAQHRGQHLARAHARLGRQPQRPHRPLPHRGWVLASAAAGGFKLVLYKINR